MGLILLANESSARHGPALVFYTLKGVRLIFLLCAGGGELYTCQVGRVTLVTGGE